MAFVCEHGKKQVPARSEEEPWVNYSIFYFLLCEVLCPTIQKDHQVQALAFLYRHSV